MVLTVAAVIDEPVAVIGANALLDDAGRAERRHVAVEMLHHERPLRGLYDQPAVAHRVAGIDRHRGVARQHRRLADAVGRDRRLHELVTLREKAALGLGIAAEPAAFGRAQVEDALAIGRETALEVPAVGGERHVRDELWVVPHDAAAVHRPLRRDRAVEHERAEVRIARLPDERQRPLGHLVVRADGNHDRLRPTCGCSYTSPVRPCSAWATP